MEGLSVAFDHACILMTATVVYYCGLHLQVDPPIVAVFILVAQSPSIVASICRKLHARLLAAYPTKQATGDALSDASETLE